MKTKHYPTLKTAFWICALLIASTGLVADDEYEPDNTTATNTALWPSMPPQRHDLENQAGVADKDLYMIFPRAERSYEIQMINITNDAADVDLKLDRRASDGTTVLQTATALHPRSPTDLLNDGFNMTLRWEQAADDGQFVCVTGSTTMSADAKYDIQMFDTTLYCPRWNNAGSQITVLIVQGAQTDTDGSTCTYTVYWYDDTITPLATSTENLSPDDVDVFVTSSISGLPGNAGGAHIAHTCGIGGLQAKAVALEPSTGFSFDTPCSYLPTR